VNRTRQGAQGRGGVNLPPAGPHRLPLDAALRRSGGALQGFHQQTRGFTRLPLTVLPGTAPLCRGASPATSPSQSEGSGQIAGPVRDACPAQARALSPLLAPRRFMSAPQEQRTSTYMHNIGKYVKCPLPLGCAPSLMEGEGRGCIPTRGAPRAASPSPDPCSRRGLPIPPAERESAFGSTALPAQRSLFRLAPHSSLSPPWEREECDPNGRD
jgi:hypothetical protein